MLHHQNVVLQYFAFFIITGINTMGDVNHTFWLVGASDSADPCPHKICCWF